MPVIAIEGSCYCCVGIVGEEEAGMGVVTVVLLINKDIVRLPVSL